MGSASPVLFCAHKTKANVRSTQRSYCTLFNQGTSLVHPFTAQRKRDKSEDQKKMSYLALLHLGHEGGREGPKGDARRPRVQVGAGEELARAHVRVDGALDGEADAEPEKD